MYGIIISQAIRFARICSKEISFVRRMGKLLCTLIYERGYDRKMCRKYLYTVMKSLTPFLFGRLSYKRLVWKVLNNADRRDRRFQLLRAAGRR